jgi:uncharacterized damage-inducible protein DinB/8-oxo-dGTP pyrophosphatase MutT (NUDIX family)
VAGVVELRVRSTTVSVVVVRRAPGGPEVLLLRRTATLAGEWCQVAGKIEPGETAWQAALREMAEETGLRPDRFYSADICEQFYEADADAITLVPVFVGFVAGDQDVAINAEHSEYRWCDFATAPALVPFPGQRHLLRQVEAEFVKRPPLALLEIALDRGPPREGHIRMDRLVAHFRAMARNNAWANARLLEACEALGPEGFSAPGVSFFPSIRATLNHLYAVDQYYIAALEEAGLGPAAFREAPDFAEPAALRTAQAASDVRLIAFCDRLTGADLDRSVVTDRGSGVRVPERIDALLAHLFQHQIHHRGQAHAMLAGTAVPPPQLDEFFLDYDRHPSAAAFLRSGGHS